MMKPLGVWAAAGLVLASMVAQLLALGVLTWTHAADGLSDMARFALADWLGTGAVLILALQMRDTRLRPLLHASPLPAGRLLLWLLWLLPPLLLAMPGVLALDALGTDLADVWFADSAWEQQAMKMFEGRGPVDVITACVIAPVLEELLFRGLILQGFAQRYGGAKALWLSALLFSAAHANVHQFLGTLPFGLLAGWLVLRTGSLWPAMVAHALFNAGALALDTDSSAWMAPAALAGAAGGWWLRAAVRALQR
jgi:membrane protease YdiL (CAAX protease family)